MTNPPVKKKGQVNKKNAEKLKLYLNTKTNDVKPNDNKVKKHCDKSQVN
jgi:hypothetical protein